MSNGDDRDFSVVGAAPRRHLRGGARCHQRASSSLSQPGVLGATRPTCQSAICDPRCAPALSASTGFTLIELLTVVGIIAIFAGIVAVALRGGDKSQARDATVSTLASLVSFARSSAALKNVDGALFVCNDTSDPERYRRYVVVCVENTTTGQWDPVDAGVTLPAGVYVLHTANPLPTGGPGLYKSSSDSWTRPSGGELRSTALQMTVMQAINSGTSEAWSYVAFTPRGTLANGTAGDIVVAAGRPTSGGAPAAILLEGSDNVGGISISNYGSVTILRHREDF